MPRSANARQPSKRYGCQDGPRPGSEVFGGELVTGGLADVAVDVGGVDRCRVAVIVEELEELLSARQESKIISHIQTLVPEYDPWAKPLGDHEKLLAAGGLSAPWPPLRSRNGNGTERHERNGASRTSGTVDRAVPPISCEY